jgi:hypothetical protein
VCVCVCVSLFLCAHVYDNSIVLVSVVRSVRKSALKKKHVVPTRSAEAARQTYKRNRESGLHDAKKQQQQQQNKAKRYKSSVDAAALDEHVESSSLPVDMNESDSDEEVNDANEAGRDDDDEQSS